MTAIIFIGITKASDLITVIMRSNNILIYMCGTKWQEWLHTSRDLRHRDEVEYMPQGRQVPVRETSDTRWKEQAHTRENLHKRDMMKIRRDERCVPAPQGRPVPVRETSGTRWQEQAHMSENLHRMDMMILRREGLFRAASGPSGMLPLGTKSWHQGMSRPGAAGRQEVLKRRYCQVRSRVDTE